MPYLVVENFNGGLDARKNVLVSKPGTLSTIKNAHITRGGEIEKRKAFSPLGQLPGNTFGMEAANSKIYVFGSADINPNISTNVIYQRLQHPDGLAMTKVVHSTVYGGLPFVIAEYSDGSRLSFWDGSIIRDSFVGIARTSMGSLDNFAEHLKLDFSFDGYTCTRTGSTLTITSPLGKAFDVAASITSPMTATVTRTQEAKDPVEGKTAYGSFTISGGKEEPATVQSGALRVMNFDSLPDVTGIYVNGVEIISLSSGSGIRYDSFPNPGGWDKAPRFALAIANFINANTSVSGFSATNWNTQVSGGVDYGYFRINADSGLGSSANGWDVKIEFLTDPSGVSNVGELIDGSPVASPYNTGRFIAELGGAGVLSGGAYNGIGSVTVDGVEIMGQTVPWKTSNSSTAQDIVDAIEAYTSTPEYLTETSNGVVTVNALPGTGSAPNGKAISVQTIGNVTVSAVIKMANGTANFAGATQISTVALGGTFTVDGKASVTITDPDVSDPYIFGASRLAGVDQNFSITYKGKEYVAAGSTMYFSALNDVNKWDIYDTGSGFIDMSNNLGSRDDLTGFGIYQGKMSVFSRRNVQLWQLDVDPVNNQQIQVLSNTGCIAPDSIISMGFIDVIYLSDNGIRSLRARDATDSAFASDIGSPIDSIITKHFQDLSQDGFPDKKYLAKAIVEPIDGRYLLSIHDKIYVLSYFPGSNVSAWSTYETGFEITEFATIGDRLYARGVNDMIYIYGGTYGTTYDNCEVVIELPYLDAQKPATYKSVKAIDMVCTGYWEVSLGTDHTAPNAKDVVARVSDSTYAYGQIPAVGIGTHIGIKMASSEPGAATISNFIVHYDDMNSKHDAG